MSKGSKGGIEVYGGLFRLVVSKDRLKALLWPAEQVTLGAIDHLKLQQEVQKHGITYGLVERLQPQPDGSLCIAQGKPPVPGENAKIKCHVRPAISNAPQKKRPGQDKVDYRELGNIVNVNKEQFLLEKVPLTEGIPGMDVMGREIPAKSGRDIKLKGGPGVLLSEDGMQVHATLDGKFVMADGRPSVYGEHVVTGDVDMSVGNILFGGESLLVHGDVLPGFKVRCKGSVQINRGINNAEVIAGSNLRINGSVVGEQSVVRAKGDVSIGFLENGPHVQAMGNLIIGDFAVQGNLQVTGDLKAIQGNGAIIGGRAVVGGSVHVKELGSDGEVLTEVSVGINPSLEARQAKLEEQAKIWPDKLNNLIKNIGALEQMKKKEGKLPPDKEELLKKLRSVMPQIVDRVNAISELEQQLQEEKEKSVNESVFVYGKVYPGVTVKIGSAVRAITAEEEEVVIHFDATNRQIHLRKLTQEEKQALPA